MVLLELRRDSRVTTGNSGCLLCWPRQVQSSIRVRRFFPFPLCFFQRFVQSPKVTMCVTRERKGERQTETLSKLCRQGWLGLSSLRIVLKNALPRTHTHTDTQTLTLKHSSAFLAPICTHGTPVQNPTAHGETSLGGGGSQHCGL